MNNYNYLNSSSERIMEYNSEYSCCLLCTGMPDVICMVLSISGTLFLLFTSFLLYLGSSSWTVAILFLISLHWEQIASRSVVYQWDGLIGLTCAWNASQTMCTTLPAHFGVFFHGTQNTATCADLFLHCKSLPKDLTCFQKLASKITGMA